MSAKKRTKSSKKPITKIKANKNKELSPLESKLLNFAKKGQSVLLFGKDTYGRNDLIRKIHLLNGGIDENWEYEGKEKNINSVGDFERAANSHDTTKTYCFEDCDLQSGKEVFKVLSSFDYKMIHPEHGVISFLIADVDPWSNTEQEPGLHEMYRMSDTKELIWRKGLLFVDYLKCKRNDPEDDEWYDKLAKKIEVRIKKYSGRGNWLVAYAHDPGTFSPYFLAQFEPVSLDSKDYEVKEQKEVKPVESTLFYNKATGTFSFGRLESTAISATRRARVRSFAEKLMECWKKRKPCSLKAFGIDPARNTPDYVYEKTSDIRIALESIKVNMPQCTESAYPPPDEPEHFDIVS